MTNCCILAANHERVHRPGRFSLTGDRKDLDTTDKTLVPVPCGQAVLVPTMTFAATAEVVRYQGAVPLLVDRLAPAGCGVLRDSGFRADLGARCRCASCAC